MGNRKVISEELCNEKMKQVGELTDQVDKVINNHIPHLNKDISDIKVDIKEIKINQKNDQERQDIKQGWMLRAVLGLYGLMSAIIVALVVNIIK